MIDEHEHTIDAQEQQTAKLFHIGAHVDEPLKLSLRKQAHREGLSVSTWLKRLIRATLAELDAARNARKGKL